ncbi:MAG: polysaccharide deacetylase family protein, partial [Oscillospiraceae bacterium]|nr:polysaccharide deacetylase family protein [Oscillospiraceae bacterium]
MFNLDNKKTVCISHQAKATFFVSGDWVDRYPDAVQSIHAAGHELANHGTNHKHMP